MNSVHYAYIFTTAVFNPIPNYCTTVHVLRICPDLFDWSNDYVRSDSSPKVQPRRKRETTGRKLKTGRAVKVNGEEVALFRLGEEVFAVKEKCPHQGGPLHLGDIEVLPDRSLCVRCPWHHWCVDLASGRVRRPSGRTQTTNVYMTKVTDDGNIFVGFKHFSNQYFQSQCEF
ncbi:putative Rieske domain-containing protein-like [Apostichopus japonicus]|uniref:Putative Rieske domain-containing protein-like n=1 Tax=Stichopus japonicus TaxID=307972 RepID=A0A2G8KEW3_STIJA|nr:putative Rieske domain-containing protein-like [Apostichopus japonicus]